MRHNPRLAAGVSLGLHAGKVLDRANVIEFRVADTEMADFLDDPRKPELSDLDDGGALFRSGFMAAARDLGATAPVEIKERFVAEMNLFFALQSEHGGEYGFRVAHEAARFLQFYKALGGGKMWDAAADAGDGKIGAWVEKDGKGRDWFDAAFDALVIQKFLPKLHGSKARLSTLLKKIYTASVGPHADAPRKFKELAEKWNDPRNLKEPSRSVPEDGCYPVAAEKVFRMWRQLNENGFTSFPEN